MSDYRNEPAGLPVLVLVRDIIFASRVRATAEALNLPIRVLRDPAELAGAGPARRLIADLNQPGAVEAAAEWAKRTGGEAVGFVSHVDAATIAAAEKAGVRAIPRSRFAADLPELLS